MKPCLLALALLFIAACDPSPRPGASNDLPGDPQPAADTQPAKPLPPAPPIPAGWFKGNLHTHSLWSDGDDFPEHITRWYKDHGYHFLAISDHGTVQSGDKWLKYADLYKKGAGPATDRFLADLSLKAQSRGDRKAETQEIRLTPFAEYHTLFEKPGSFLMIQAEEISDKLDKKPVHMGGINLAETIKAKGGKTIVEIISNNLRAVMEQGKKLDRPVIAHLNHPNFGWGVTAEELAQVLEEYYFEVFNGHPSVNQMGDPKNLTAKPSVDRIWDIANTLRLTTLKGRPLFGLGNDDSHSYHVPGISRATPGRGWTVVRAKDLTIPSLFSAIEAGDFYASTGVVLRDVKFNPASKTLSIEIIPTDTATYTTHFIGTRLPPGTQAASYTPAPSDVGITLASVPGLQPSYTLKGDELYVRAVVISSLPPAVPSFKGQVQQAWTQPVGWQKP